MAIQNMTQKQPVYILVGILLLVILAAVLVGIYGKSAKTQVALPDAQMTQLAKFRTDNLEPGTYTLKFIGSNNRGTVTAGKQFEVLENNGSTVPSTPVNGYNSDILPVSN